MSCYYVYTMHCANLLKKKGFFPMTTGIAFQNSKRAYLAKTNFIIH